MSFTEEFVRQLASVKCSENQHPIAPEYPRSQFDECGYSAPVDDNRSPEQKAEWQKQLSIYHKKLAAQCLFCIARATLERSGESPVTSLTCTMCNGYNSHTLSSCCSECRAKMYGPPPTRKNWDDKAHITLWGLVEEYKNILTKRAENFSRGASVTEQDVISGHQSVWDRS